MSKTTNDLCRVFDMLIKSASKQYRQAKEFQESGELVGTLFNYMLCLENIDHAVGVGVSMNSCGIKPDDISWCEDTCAQLHEIRDEVLSYIPDLQKQVKKVVTKGYAGGSTPVEDEDDINCTDVTQLMTSSGNSCLTFDNVIGLDSVKEDLYASLLYPLAYPNLYPKLAKGILLYGPPGTGKTYIMKAAVNQLQLEDNSVGVLFFAPTGADLKGKYVGETEKKISAYFKCSSEYASDCESNSKNKRYVSVLFIDEIDAIAGDRSKDESGMMASSVNTLLQKMDGIASYPNVTVVAATNLPWSLDSAVKRRFDKEVFVDLPDRDSLKELLYSELSKHIEIKPEELSIKKSIKKEKGSVKAKGKGACPVKCVRTQPFSILDVSGPNDVFYHKYIDSDWFTDEQNDKVNILIDEILENNYSNSDLSRLAKAAARIASNRAKQLGVFTLTKFGEDFLYLPYTINKDPAKSDKYPKFYRLSAKNTRPETGIIMFNREKYTDINFLIDRQDIEYLNVGNISRVYKHQEDKCIIQIDASDIDGKNPILSFFIHIEYKPKDLIMPEYTSEGWKTWIWSHDNTATRLLRIVNHDNIWLLESSNAFRRINRKHTIQNLLKYAKTNVVQGYAIKSSSISYYSKEGEIDNNITFENVKPGKGILMAPDIPEEMIPTIKMMLKTTDIRVEDFVEASSLIKSSIKADEYIELKNYNENPSIYKPKK